MVCFFGMINVNRKTNDVNLLHFKLYWNTQLAIKAKKVGMTGFEPATPRTPCVCATRLRHIPNKRSVLKSRGGRIRTCDLLLPKQAR